MSVFVVVKLLSAVLIDGLKVMDPGERLKRGIKDKDKESLLSLMVP